MITPGDLRSRLEGAVGREEDYMARCPAHSDTNNSLHVSRLKNGSTGLYCHAGCSIEDVCAALGIDKSDLYPDKPSRKPDKKLSGKPEAIYEYRTADGKLLYRKFRYPDKVLFCKPKLEGVKERPLYRLRDAVEAIHSGRRVYLSESEKDADRVTAAGFACCSSGGCTRWHREHAAVLKNAADPVVLVHKDSKGHDYARKVKRDCPQARCIELPDCLNDAADFLASHTPEEFRAAVEQELSRPEPEWLTDPTPDAQPPPDAPQMTPERVKLSELAGLFQFLATDPAATPEDIRHATADALGSLSEVLPTLDQPWTWTNILEAEEVPPPLFRHGPTPGELGLVYAESAGGKSYLALIFSLSLALVRPLLPTFAPTGIGRVVYLSFEDRGPLIRWRLRAIAAAHGIAFSEVVAALQDGRLRFRCDIPGALFEQESRGAQPTATPLWRTFEAQVRAERPALIVLDPFSATAVLEDENSARPIHAVAAAVANLAAEIGAVALVLHHTSKQRASEGTQHAGRGSSALAARARWIMNLTPKDSADVIEVTVSKNTYARPPDPVWLRRGEGGVLTETPRLSGKGTMSRDTLIDAVITWLSENPDKVVSAAAVAGNRGDSADLFAALKAQFGTAVTKTGIKDALKAGIEAGLLRENKEFIRGGEIFRIVPADSEGDV